MLEHGSSRGVRLNDSMEADVAKKITEK